MIEKRFHKDMLNIVDVLTNKAYTFEFEEDIDEMLDLLNSLNDELEESSAFIIEQRKENKTLKEENEQLKIVNARWLDKSLQDKQIRYDNPTCKELTRKYLQLKDENEQLKKSEKINMEYAEIILEENHKLRIVKNDLRIENEQLKKELLRIEQTVSSIQKEINDYYNEVCSNE